MSVGSIDWSSSILATHKLPQYRLAGNGPCGLCWKLLCVLGSGLGFPEYFITDGFIRVYLVFNTGLDGSSFFVYSFISFDIELHKGQAGFEVTV